MFWIASIKSQKPQSQFDGVTLDTNDPGYIFSGLWLRQKTYENPRISEKQLSSQNKKVSFQVSFREILMQSPFYLRYMLY